MGRQRAANAKHIAIIYFVTSQVAIKMSKYLKNHNLLVAVRCADTSLNFATLFASLCSAASFSLLFYLILFQHTNVWWFCLLFVAVRPCARSLGKPMKFWLFEAIVCDCSIHLLSFSLFCEILFFHRITKGTIDKRAKTWCTCRALNTQLLQPNWYTISMRHENKVFFAE